MKEAKKKVSDAEKAKADAAAEGANAKATAEKLDAAIAEQQDLIKSLQAEKAALIAKTKAFIESL